MAPGAAGWKSSAPSPALTGALAGHTHPPGCLSRLLLALLTFPSHHLKDTSNHKPGHAMPDVGWGGWELAMPDVGRGECQHRKMARPGFGSRMGLPALQSFWPVSGEVARLQQQTLDLSSSARVPLLSSGPSNTSGPQHTAGHQFPPPQGALSATSSQPEAQETHILSLGSPPPWIRDPWGREPEGELCRTQPGEGPGHHSSPPRPSAGGSGFPQGWL